MKKIILLTLLSALTIPTYAGEKEIRQKFNSTFPNKVLDSIEYIKEVKLYELVVQKSPTKLYTNENFDFIIGSQDISIIDPKTKTEPLYEKEFVKSKEFFKTLPLDKAIKIKYGTGERKVVIFADPDCPSCGELEMNLENYKGNTTFYYLMNPLDSIHPEARNKAKKIICSSNPEKSWKKAMTQRKIPDNNGNCEKAKNVDLTKEFASKNNINATPTIYIDNGFILDGSPTIKKLDEVINSKKP